MSASYLLDTHVLMWALDGPENLKPETRKLLSDRSNRALVSVASVWEMAIKSSLGKLPRLPRDYMSILRSQGFVLLPISPEHALAVQHLPLYHRDPFDRILIAQARQQKLPLITHDRYFARYDIKVIPA